MEWQSVSTAPLNEDRQAILGFSPVMGRQVVYYAGYAFDGAPQWCNGDVEFPITHWMPLPPPPTAPEPAPAS